MTAKLTRLAQTATESDCTAMLDELLNFGSEELSQAAQNDIISRVTGKAEKEMTDTKIKPKKKIKRKVITFLVAAAILLPTGAYAAGRLFHKDNVEVYLKGSERIEQNESAVKNYVMENEDFRITIDSQLSDGHNVMMIETYEGKTRYGRNYINDMADFGAKSEYADGTEIDLDYTWGIEPIDSIHMRRGGHAKSGDAKVKVYSCNGLNIQNDIKMTYYAFAGEKGRTKLDGFEFTTNFKPNVKSVELKSADGKKLVLSEFEIYSPNNEKIGDQLGDSIYSVSQNVSLIKTNGEKYHFSPENKTSALEDHIIFGEIINVYDFKGVEINGVEYLK